MDRVAAKNNRDERVLLEKEEAAKASCQIKIWIRAKILLAMQGNTSTKSGYLDRHHAAVYTA